MPPPTRLRPPARAVATVGVTRLAAATRRARALVVRLQELTASRCLLPLRRGKDSLMSRCWPRWMDGGHGHDEVGVDFRSC